jgi:hypothetical protein
MQQIHTEAPIKLYSEVGARPIPTDLNEIPELAHLFADALIATNSGLGFVKPEVTFAALSGIGWSAPGKVSRYGALPSFWD